MRSVRLRTFVRAVFCLSMSLITSSAWAGEATRVQDSDGVNQLVTGQGCTCPCARDPHCDGILFDVYDVIEVINVAFRNCPTVIDVGCPYVRTDLDKNGFTDVIDVTMAVNTAFRCGIPSNLPDPCSGPMGIAESIAPSSVQRIMTVSAANSVVVESKTFSPGTMGAQVGIHITNSDPLIGITLPLELREITPGAYVSGAFTLLLVPGNRVGSSPIGGTMQPSGAVGFTQISNYATPAIQACSGPLTQTWCPRTPSIDYISPDASSFVGLSAGFPGTDDMDLDAGSDPPGTSNASFIVTFNVSNTPGSFMIDTCCMMPAMHLAFVTYAGTDICDGPALAASASDLVVVPSFVPGIITIQVPVGCSTRTSTDRFLVACPKGDTAFHVTLQDGAGDPILGYSDVWLDFSACPGSELLPIAGQHPSWPIVPAPGPSDANGDIAFNIFAGGDCADCQVTVNTGCGFSATVPVHSVDVDGDLCVTEVDHDDAEGICRDYNADLVVDHDDIALHIDHLDHCAPAGPCDYLDIDVSVRPQESIAQGDSVFVNWTVTNTSTGNACTVDSVVVYHFDCESSASERWVGAIAVGTLLGPGDDVSGLIEYTNPDSLDFCMQVRVYSDCCDTFAVTIIRITPERLCSPSDSCFVFYCSQLTIAGVLFDPPGLLAEGWSYEVINTTVLIDGVPTPVTQTTICTGPSPTEGTTGYVRIRHTGFGSPKVYSVTVKAQEGDVCGQIGECQGTLDRRMPDCVLDILDVVCLIEYIFRAGPVPCPAQNTDLNCDCVPDVLDIVTEVNTVFRGQPPPRECDVVCP